ncbi:flavin reductase [Micromonospora deserti]|uniref:Flavin reductase n=1 Tax=Micromonospora deserti TaxID=2070366 RepID=A0A2W2DC40_9ACTN|nr:flavin reductase [Micromonospora deserti]PZF94636.1 flavin reductase [Micromonospora deserti]
MPRYRPHVAARPSWRCRVCGVAWPCSPARLALLGEYRHDRTALLIYLGTLLHEAMTDLAGLSERASPPSRPGGREAPGELSHRFLTWAKARDS